MIVVMADDEDIKTEDAVDVSADGVVEGEVVSGDSVDVGTDQQDVEKIEADDQAELVMKLEGMIKNNNSQIAKLSAELSEAREMLKDSFENDATYKEHADAAKEANKVKAATKAQILKQPTVKALADKVKTLSSELKELKEGLSDYLREFNRLSGITEIEGDDGELLEIVYVAKLVKRKISR